METEKVTKMKDKTDPSRTETFWSTEHALTRGIVKVEGQELTGGAISVDTGKSMPIFLHSEGKNWHRTREGAVARADKLRKAKIDSLKRQIAKLESLSFDD